MDKKEYLLVDKAIEYFHSLGKIHSRYFMLHRYKFVSDSVSICREIAEQEEPGIEDLEPALAALILNDLGSLPAVDSEMNPVNCLDDFLQKNNIPEAESTRLRHYINFLHAGKPAQTLLEKILYDSGNIFTGLPQFFDWMDFQREWEQKIYNRNYTDLEWLEKGKEYFTDLGFQTSYAGYVYGTTRKRNQVELEKRITDIINRSLKEKRNADKENENGLLPNRENEQLFKIAFRNYINLIAVADRKAGLLIQVNSILAPLVYGMVIKRIELNHYYAIPTAVILVTSVLTIFYGILASKPLKREMSYTTTTEREKFFFGSFDRLDPGFSNVSWEKYSSDMNEFFKGDKKLVFDELIKESFHVRKVLSKKFGYLSIAYMVFFIGLLLGIAGFLALILVGNNLPVF